MHAFLVHLSARVVLPLGALAVLGAGSVTGASAAGLGSSCPIFGCTPPVPNITIAPQQLIVNGGFENSSTGWILNPGAAVDSTKARCGRSSLALHTYDTGSTSIFWPGFWAGEADQTVNIPANSNGAVLDLWVFFPPYAYARESRIDVMGAAASNSYIFTELAGFSNATVTPGIWRHLGPIDVTKFQGGPLALLISGSTPTDGSTGPIYVDDVSLRTGLQLPTASSSC